MENELEQQEAQENLEESEVVEETTEDEVSVEDQLEAERKKVKEYEAKMKHWRKKAQEAPKENEESPKTSGLSNDDILALADVKDKEDRKFLIEKSKDLGKSIEELQADPYMQAALRTMSEERATAQATNTGKQKRGVKDTNPEAVVAAANSGKDVDPAQLAEAQFALRRQRTE